jgi:AraC-like DNA-binding protein
VAIDPHLQRREYAREPERPGSTHLKMIHVHGRCGGARLPAGTIALLVNLSGRLALESPDSRWELPRRSALLWREGPLRITSHASSRCLALYGEADAWRPHLPALGQPQLTLFPWEGPCPRTIARAMLQIARAMNPGRSPRPGEALRGAVGNLCSALDEQQAWLLQPLQRCSGRTLQHRQRTLLRLLRVRNMIRRTGDSRVDLSRLAAFASYSPCHLLRIYRDAFGETPSEYASSLRHQRAWALVHETRMQVHEITELLGFESQSSFCRAFKSAFGTTTSEARRRQAARLAEGRQARSVARARTSNAIAAAERLGGPCRSSSGYLASPRAARTGSR